VRHYYVYIMTNRKNGTLYVGVTGSLLERVRQHRDGAVEGFTKRYGLTRLVYYEVFDNPREAIWREKRIKTWLRAWKVRLIRGVNPEWEDLWERLPNELPFA
jgi:putative endonuclease